MAKQKEEALEVEGVVTQRDVLDELLSAPS